MCSRRTPDQERTKGASQRNGLPRTSPEHSGKDGNSRVKSQHAWAAHVISISPDHTPSVARRNSRKRSAAIRRSGPWLALECRLGAAIGLRRPALEDRELLLWNPGGKKYEGQVNGGRVGDVVRFFGMAVDGQAGGTAAVRRSERRCHGRGGPRHSSELQASEVSFGKKLEAGTDF